MKPVKTIRDWQVHNLDLDDRQLEGIEPYKPLIVTGTVVDDPTEKFKVGWHMRSTLVKKLDREKGFLETKNTIYKLEGTEGKDVVPDLGNGVLNLFY